MAYRLIKTEPYKYSRDDLIKDGQTVRDGVRNYQARNNLQKMKVDDICLWYHSNEGKEIIGTAEVIREAYQDPTTDDERRVVVDIKPLQKFDRPVTLEKIKQTPELADMILLKQQRLSVAPVQKKEFIIIDKMSQ
jgi:predicted RNA-binding protein with PUA-like domain